MATRNYSAFVAYPGAPADLANPISAAADQVARDGKVQITAWPRMEVFGAQIPDEVRGSIEASDIIFADITRPNLNVYYEIGFAIGLGKTFAPIVNTSFAQATNNIRSVGLFTNIGYSTYENSAQLQTIFLNTPKSPLLGLYARDVNYSQPLYVLDTMRKTDFRNAVVSAVKESRSHFRSFDPIESARITVVQLIAEVTASSGVILPYLPTHIDDSERHNLRAAFIAGLAVGLARETLIVTDQEDDQAPTDYNEIS